MKKTVLLFILSILAMTSFGQGTLTGDLMMNLNFFQEDPAIKASGNPLYDNYLSGSEGWLGLRYNNNGFTVSARIDGFNNSNLKNPTQANTAYGIGAWSVSKNVKDLTITVGYIYDQIGSGILFRSYEDRGLLIDNALIGFELKYKLSDNILLKGFTGQQKNNENLGNNPLNVSQKYAPIIKAINAEGDFSLGKAHIFPGIGVLNRTMDQTSMTAIVNGVDAQDLSTRFEPTFNMYAFTAYNTLTIGNLSWYAEGAYKTHEAIQDPNPGGLLVDKAGNVEYTTLGYAKKGIAINLSGKRTEYFVMCTSPNEILTNGMLNWQPVVAVIRPGRLMSRYTPASQDFSEMAWSANVLVSPNDNLAMTFTGTSINTLENIELYREGYVDAVYTGWKSWALQGGVQYLEYNRQVYQVVPDAPIVKAITPFAELTYKINNTRSLRMEVEYMNAQQDYGSWIYAILEYNIAPRWSLSVSDMYNTSPNKNPDNPNYNTTTNSVPAANHYYNIYAAYTKNAHRFALAYVKQVDGINCAGGVCRYEPAFSGIKATITSSF